MNDHLLNIFSESGCPPHETLVAYFRNRLPEEERHLVEQHLVDCAMCSDELEGLSLMKDPGELDRMVEEIGTGIEERRGRVVHFNRRVLLLAVAAVIVFLAGSALVIRLLIPAREQARMSVSLMAPAAERFNEMPPPPPPPAPEKPQPVPRKPISSASPGVTAIEDTQAISAEQLVVAGVSPAAEEDSQIVAEARAVEAPAPVIRPQVTTVQAEEKEDARKADVSKKSQAMMFTAYPGKADTISEALELYFQANYRKALELFSLVLASQPDNFKALYYSALCHYRIGEPRNAERALDPILKRPGNEFYGRAQRLSEKIREEQDSLGPRSDSMK